MGKRCVSLSNNRVSANHLGLHKQMMVTLADCPLIECYEMMEVIGVRSSHHILYLQLLPGYFVRNNQTSQASVVPLFYIQSRGVESDWWTWIFIV